MVDITQAQTSTHRARVLEHPALAQLNSIRLLTPVSVDGDGCPLLNAMLVIHNFPFM